MRYIGLGIFFCYVCIVFCKTNVKTLTDSMGQEIIEVDGPKELPLGLDEEPGADSDEDDLLLATATKKDTKKSTTLQTSRRNMKDIEKIDGTSPEEEEAKLEKELAEIYKDTDYKDITEETIVRQESSETTTAASATTEDLEKPSARSNDKNGFKFAPDSTNKADVEKFRTSIDDISCKNRQKLSVTSSLKGPHPIKPNSGNKFNAAMMVTHIGLMLVTVACI